MEIKTQIQAKRSQESKMITPQKRQEGGKEKASGSKES